MGLTGRRGERGVLDELDQCGAGGREPGAGGAR